MKKYKKHLLFLLFLSILYGYLGFYTMLTKRPQSVHQWAQCDRASVALNYAQESMNLFLPRVHDMNNRTGITGMEFPLMNYLAAILYKFFGVS